MESSVLCSAVNIAAIFFLVFLSGESFMSYDSDFISYAVVLNL